MRWVRDMFSDLLVATGAAIVVFSIVVVVLILVMAVPTGNPYIGFFTFILLPALAMTGGMVFFFGVLLGRRRSKPNNHEPDKAEVKDQQDNRHNGNHDTAPGAAR